MDSTPHVATFLGIDWNFWKYLGWLGNAVFFSRFLVQWWATEKRKQVVIPNAFWYLSLAGSFILLAYSFHKRDSVFIFAYLFTWIPYIRNLMISHRMKKAMPSCTECRTAAPEHAR
ncbi:MAG TPA: lipid-A-disaccharide synthase N-terminal domain-containing protein, partial [Candidatus Saccharimonadales bacterium]|nr:lipid-A-disaccharide synthase N-terminal domain-containing protein [Candidatus Saccharimonadales bacterium]